MKPYANFFKPLIDFVGALAIVSVLLPVYLIFYILVRATMGSPVFFTQERPGKGEKIFKIYKFRSMVDARDADGNLHDPLLDAPNRSLMTCTSEAPVTVLQRVGEVPFACPDLGVSATLDELRDAGWRILRLDIGEDLESDSHVGFPVTVQVRKLF